MVTYFPRLEIFLTFYAQVLKLSAHYITTTKDDSVCTSTWFQGVAKIVDAMTYQQQELSTMNPNDDLYYSFARQTNTQVLAYLVCYPLINT